MDRDYMHDKGRQRPFSPPPERISTLDKALIFVVILVLLYLAGDWVLNQRTPSKRGHQAPAEPEQVERPASASKPLSRQAMPDPTYPRMPETNDNTRTVTKCVVNGKTSYGDGDCVRGATTSQVTTRADHNVMQPVRPSAAPPREVTYVQETVVTQSTDALDTKKSECTWIDERIKYLDAMARQPQSGQMQDWITAERKRLRDRQFRIPCR